MADSSAQHVASPPDAAPSDALSPATGEVRAAADASDAAPPAAAAAPAAAVQHFTIRGAFLKEMTEQGFSENSVKKAIACGCPEISSVVSQWIMMQLDEPTLNDPLPPEMVVEVRELSAAEREAKVQELKHKIHEKKIQQAAEEKAREIQAEKERVQMGLNALRAKEEREALLRARQYEERRKEQEADRIAKEKITLELAIDKLVRKGMKVEEATEVATREREAAKKALLEKMQQEQEAQRARFAQAAAATARPAASDAASASGGSSDGVWQIKVPGAVAFDDEAQSTSQDTFDRSSLPPPTEAGFRQLWDRVLASSASAEAKAGTQKVLVGILQRIADTPFELKVRNIRGSSTVFATSVVSMPGALDFFRLAGFERTASTGDWLMSGYVISKVAAALVVLRSPSSSAAPPF